MLVATPDADLAELRARAAERRVGHALDALTQIATEMADGRELPASDVLHQLARAALRVECTRRES